MSEKSADAFRTISEVAEELKLPQHVLRFWETRFSQIRPMKRGGGRRYYKPDDVELLRGIQYLLYVKGMTIKGVQRILKDNGPRFVVAVGTGDTAALDAMQASRTAAPRSEAEPHLRDHDLVAPEPVTDTREEEEPDETVEPAEDRHADPRPRGISSFLKRGRGTDDDETRGRGLSKESCDELDTIILDLLECKRLLDQVR